MVVYLRILIDLVLGEPDILLKEDEEGELQGILLLVDGEGRLFLTDIKLVLGLVVERDFQRCAFSKQ